MLGVGDATRFIFVRNRSEIGMGRVRVNFESSERKGVPNGNYELECQIYRISLVRGRVRSIFEGGDDGHVRVGRVLRAQCCEAG